MRAHRDGCVTATGRHGHPLLRTLAIAHSLSWPFTSMNDPQCAYWHEYIFLPLVCAAFHRSACAAIGFETREDAWGCVGRSGQSHARPAPACGCSKGRPPHAQAHIPVPGVFDLEVRHHHGGPRGCGQGVRRMPWPPPAFEPSCRCASRAETERHARTHPPCRPSRITTMPPLIPTGPTWWACTRTSPC